MLRTFAKRPDCWAGTLVGVVGLIAVLAAWPLDWWTEFGPGPGFVPVLLGIALIAMGGAVAFSALRRRVGTQWQLPPLRKPLVVAGIMAVYLALLDVLGFPLSTALFLFALLHWVESRGTGQALALAVSITAGLHLIFSVLLKTALPLGVLAWIF